ncbi:hypothetical protein EMCRGX_G005458 [Ephydatia muelleri]
MSLPTRGDSNASTARGPCHQDRASATTRGGLTRLPCRQRRGCVATPEQPIRGTPLPDEDTTPTPSPTVRELVLMQEDPREQTRTSAMVEMANRTLRDLRRPAGKVTSQTISTPSPRSGEGIQGTPPPDDSEGVETLDRLIVTPLAWDRNQTPSTPSTEVAQSLDEARDRDELIVSPLPCTEGNWMSYASYFSPVSPNLMGYSPGPTTGETEGRGVIEPEEEAPQTTRRAPGPLEGNGRPVPLIGAPGINQSHKGVTDRGLGVRQGPSCSRGTDCRLNTADKRTAEHPPPAQPTHTNRGTAPLQQNRSGPITRAPDTINRANQQAEVMTPQKAWQRRQREKRQRGQGAESIERPEGPPQAGQRNRTITRMATLQRRYNNSPRQCMDAIRHSPPVLRCEVPIEAVNTYFAAKLAPTQVLKVMACAAITLELAYSLVYWLKFTVDVLKSSMRFAYVLVLKHRQYDQTV